MSSLFTSESVCAGHPDKICDQVSDAIVDAALEQDPLSRVAVETLVTKDRVVLAGEVTSLATLDYTDIARGVVRELGYVHEQWGFWDQSPVEVLVHQQSADIAQGVDAGGAGDQGMMFGYAGRQTEELMPLPILLAHRLAKELDTLKAKHTFLRPDGKTQVTVRYEGRKPVEVESVVMAVPHEETMEQGEVKTFLYQELVRPALEVCGFSVPWERVTLNGTGVWYVGGPVADTGVTGRKIVVDTYGGWSRVGGGCFSGKDATKVDRSGAYAARFLARQVVQEGLADECEVEVAYVIGQPEPVSLLVETFRTEKKNLQIIYDFARKALSFKVGDIIDTFGLRKPIFKQTAAYGHFGRERLPWEK